MSVQATGLDQQPSFVPLACQRAQQGIHLQNEDPSSHPPRKPASNKPPTKPREPPHHVNHLTPPKTLNLTRVGLQAQRSVPCQRFLKTQTRVKTHFGACSLYAARERRRALVPLPAPRATGNRASIARNETPALRSSLIRFTNLAFVIFSSSCRPAHSARQKNRIVTQAACTRFFSGPLVFFPVLGPHRRPLGRRGMLAATRME